MKKKILIIGFGTIAKVHFNIINKLLPNSKIKILQINEVKLKNSHYSKHYIFLNEITEFKPDLAVITNPSSLHLKYAIQMAKLGCDLFIEKPISNNLNLIKKFLDVVKKKRLIVNIGYNLRYLESLRVFKKKINSNILGKILFVKSEVGQSLETWRKKLDYRISVSAKKKTGGGALLELSHEIDYLIWIFHNVSLVKSLISKQSNLKIDVEDSAHLILKIIFNKNIIVSNLSIDFVRHDKTRLCTVIGERGTLRWNGVEGKVDFYSSKSKSWKTIIHKKNEMAESYKRQWGDFLKCVKSRKKSSIACVNDSIKVLKIIEDAKNNESKKITL
tara:strand:+ start:71 stop:1063 length:993 start_codon:yes stop_codon:yes gene_type:complete